MMRHDIAFAAIQENVPLKRIIWVTDLHLDAACPEAHRFFFNLVYAHDPHFVLVGGDICNGKQSLSIIHQLQRIIKKPVFYVLGNHDFYYGSINEIRQLAAQDATDEVAYLTARDVIELTPNTALIGHDGWSDASEGDFLSSDILLNDYFLIDELKDISPREREKRLKHLGQEAAENIAPRLEKALQNYDHIVFLTHAPPFREACLYNGQITDDNWAPHFVCRALGEALRPLMERYPEKRLLVLSGHSHQAADVHILPNLHVLAGDSTLGEPIIQGIIHIG